MSFKVRYAFSFAWDYYRALRALDKAAPDENSALADNRVVLDLRTDRMLVDAGRYLYLVVEAFRQAGVGVDIRRNRWFLARAGRKYFGRATLALPAVKVVGTDAPCDEKIAILSDWDSSMTRVVFGDAPREESDVFPYPMYPDSYGLGNLRQLRADRVHHEDARVFFSGNLNHKYDNDILRRKFDVLTRARIVDSLKQRFGAQLLPQQSDHASLRNSMLSNDSARLVLNDLNQCPVPHDCWLKTLSQADFFLCCPGVSHPLCHNAVEAMSVGTIPIVEFPNQFRPTLQDNLNAITFDGIDGLHDAVKRAFNMSVNQRREMSQAVIEYYQKHLCIGRFIRRWWERGATDPISFPYIPAA